MYRYHSFVKIIPLISPIKIHSLKRNKESQNFYINEKNNRFCILYAHAVFCSM